MQEELVRIQKRLGTTFVHVTHDQEEAMSVADRIIVLNQGRIEDMGPPARVYLKPASLFAATFMGESNLFEAMVRERSGAEIRVESPLGAITLPGSAAPGERVTLCIRPEQFRLAAADEHDALRFGRARLTQISFQGSYLRCRAVVEGTPPLELLMRLPIGAAAEAAIEVGAMVDVAVCHGDIVALPA